MAIVQISLAEASAELVSLVEAALTGEEVVILKDNQPIMKLTPLELSQKRRPAKAGSAKGLDALCQPRLSKKFCLGRTSKSLLRQKTYTYPPFKCEWSEERYLLHPLSACART